MYLYIVVLFFVYLIKIVGEMRVKSNKYQHVPNPCIKDLDCIEFHSM